MANFLMVMLPPVYALATAVGASLADLLYSDTSFFYFGLGLLISGWCFLVWSKWDQLRKGDLRTFGAGAMPKAHRLYVLGYRMMLIGFFISLFAVRWGPKGTSLRHKLYWDSIQKYRYE